MIARVLIFAVSAGLAIAAANRLLRLLPARRPDNGNDGWRDGRGEGVARVEQAGKCPACGAWVVAGDHCRCGH